MKANDVVYVYRRSRWCRGVVLRLNRSGDKALVKLDNGQELWRPVGDLGTQETMFAKK